jgi:cation transport ATPase
MMNQPSKSLADSRFRGLVLIWGVQLFSLALLFTVMQIVRPSLEIEFNQTLLFTFAALALATFSASFVLKSQFVSRATTERRPDLVTTGYILAYALCEACAVLGIVARFATGAREAIYFFVAALVGFLLHFPRRRHIQDATVEQGQTFTTTL